MNILRELYVVSIYSLMKPVNTQWSVHSYLLYYLWSAAVQQDPDNLNKLYPINEGKKTISLIVLPVSRSSSSSSRFTINIAINTSEQADNYIYTN